VAIEPFALERFAPRKPWLVIGSDPSFAAYDASLSQSHDVFALDMAMRGLRASVGHALDLAALEQVPPRELSGIEYLCVPWTLRALASPLAKSYAERGRLLAYNLGKADNPALPLVEASSGPGIAVRLLAQSGARVIRTLGIDSDVEGFELRELATTLNLYDVLCGPLDWELPARVLVSCEPRHQLACRVLEFALRRHASISVQVERLHEALERRGIAAPESLERLAIPELRGNRGRAIWLHAATLVTRDIRELWGMEIAGEERPGAAIALIDCESGKYVTPPWSLARYADGAPWSDPLHPDAALWSRYLLDAVASEHIDEDFLKEEVRMGHARPSLLTQLERGEPDPRRLPFGVLRREVGTWKALIRGQGRN
jgi:hypothetical protein